MSDFIAKPVHREELLRTLKRWIVNTDRLRDRMITGANAAGSRG